MKLKSCLNCSGEIPKGRQKYCCAYCSNSHHGKTWFLANPEKERERKMLYMRNYVVEKHDHWRKINSKATLKYKDKVRFNKQRERIFALYENKCAICGDSKSKFHIHHVNGISYHNSEKPDNRTENLLLLCASCHSKLHHQMKKGEITEEDIVRTYVRT